MTYRSLVRMLAKEFGPRECPENYFQELSKREQKSGESLYNLGQDIKRLTALACPRTDRVERDRIAREYFKQAVADSDIRKELFRSRPETLEDAVHAAQSIESFYRAEKNRGRNRLYVYLGSRGERSA